MANNLPHSPDVGSLIRIKELRGNIKEIDVLDVSMIIPIIDNMVRQRYIDAGLIEIVEVGN